MCASLPRDQHFCSSSAASSNQFLEAVQSTGAAPPRAVLVQRCAHDMALVESICQAAMDVSGVAAKSKATIAFASVLVETVAEVPIVSTHLAGALMIIKR